MQNNDDDNSNDNNNNNNNNSKNNDKYTELYGLARLRELSKNYAKEKDIDGEKNILHAEAQSSSVGRFDMGYWGDFARSCNVSVENMRYVWPSDRQLLANENIHGLGMLCSPTGTMQGWMKDHLVALRVPKEHPSRCYMQKRWLHITTTQIIIAENTISVKMMYPAALRVIVMKVLQVKVQVGIVNLMVFPLTIRRIIKV